MPFSDLSLYLESRPSWRYLALLTWAHAIGLAGLLFNPVLHNAVGAFLTLLALLSLVHMAASRALLLRDSSILRVLLSEGRFMLVTRGGDRLPAELTSAWVLSDWLVFLSFRTPGHPLRRRHLVLMADSTTPDAFRRARVLFRWGKMPPRVPGASTV